MPFYKDEKTGTYYFKINYKDNGKYKQILRRGFKGIREVKAAMVEIENQINKGTFIKPSTMLYRDFIEDWMEDKKINIKPSTWKNYANLVKNHILPMRKNYKEKEVGLGDKEIGNMTFRHIQDLINHMFKTSELSDENIQKCYALIKESLKQAKVEKKISENPAEFVKRPTSRKKEMKVWSLEEAHKFLKTAKENRYYIVFLLALTTGMRQGEILGLRWQDVDFERRIVSVTQILTHDGKGFESGAKTKAGSRPIKVDVETMKELSDHLRKSKEEKMANRSIYQDNGLVACTSLGTPVSPRNINRSFHRLIEKANVTKIRFHDLRHTHATFLIKNRETPQSIADRMGWADTRMIDKYAHIRPDIQEDTADMFGKTFYNDKTI